MDTRRDDILNEMRGISQLIADSGAVNAYTLPEGYFERLPDIILEKIQAAPAMLPETANIYQVPENYFDTLPGIILSKIQEGQMQSNEVREELETLGPLLNTISKKPLFSLPDGYFEQLRPAMKEADVLQGKAKLVRFKTYRRWIQYAAAAMVAGILVSGAFLFTDSNSYLELEKKGRIDLQASPDTAKDAAVVKPDTDNSQVEAQNIEETEKADETGINSVGRSTPSKTILELLSDEELKRYLEENAIPEPVYPDSTETEDSL
jgi:hypothetical protein